MKRYLQTILWLYLLSEVLCRGHKDKTSSNWEREKEKDEMASITCECGKKGKMVKKRLERDLVKNIFHHEAQSLVSQGFVPEYSRTILRLLKKCNACELSYADCYGDPDDFDNYKCSENTALIEGSHRKLSLSYNGTDYSQSIKLTNKSVTKYPKVVHFLTGHNRIEEMRLNRHKRQIEACGYPTSLQSAELKCKIFPSKVKCMQKCAVGFTLDKGTQVMRICLQDDNVWKPGSFEECRPFIDCSLTLVSGGSKTCSTPTTSSNVKCRVKCEPYEDKPATDERTYTCDTDGKWSPSLPFCVQAGSGLDLAPKPHKSHKKEKDHYYYNYSF